MVQRQPIRIGDGTDVYGKARPGHHPDLVAFCHLGLGDSVSPQRVASLHLGKGIGYNM